MEYTGGYVNLGRSGLKVSRVAFGCGFRHEPPKDVAVRAITGAIESGVNFVDCANIYTIENKEKSEVALGEALKGRREKAIITSKVGSWVKKDDNGPNGYGGSRYHILREVEKSLKRLQTDYIDVYLLHQPDPTTPEEEIFRAMEKLVQDGKIRYVGLCNFDAWEIMSGLAMQYKLDASPLICAQNPYNLLNRKLEEEMFPMARRHGVGIMAYSCLGAGLLGGHYHKGQPAPENSFWNTSPLYRAFYPYLFNGQVGDVVEKVEELSHKYNVPMSQISAAWVLTHPEVSCIVAGANNYEEFEDSIAAANLKLEQADVDELNRISEGLRISLTLPDVQKFMAAKGYKI